MNNAADQLLRQQ